MSLGVSVTAPCFLLQQGLLLPFGVPPQPSADAVPKSRGWERTGMAPHHLGLLSQACCQQVTPGC